MLADNIIWAVSLKLVRVTDEKMFKKRAALFRVGAIIAQAALLARESRAASRVERKRIKDGVTDAEARQQRLQTADRQMKALKLVCDLLTYAQASGLARALSGRELHDGHVGLLGLVSAVAGSRTCWRKSCKASACYA